jgi:hypothetical protein
MSDDPQPQYGDLSPLEVAQARLKRVNAAIAQHEAYLAALAAPAEQRSAVEKPTGLTLGQLKDARRMLLAEIARLEQGSPPAGVLEDRRN